MLSLLLLAGLAGAGMLLLARAAGLSIILSLVLLLPVIFLGHVLLSKDRSGSDDAVPLKPRVTAVPGAEGPGAVPIAALPDPALLVSGGWRIVAANEAAAGLFGPRVSGTDLRQTIRHPAIVEAVRSAMGGVSPAVREVTTLGQPEGAYRVRVAALADGRLLLTFADITQTRLTERMRADFVANASHELRTPLANISGFIETLLGPAAEDEPARRRFLEIMGREAARMSRLIDDLLSLSRIELDKYVRPQTPLDLPPLLADVGKTLAMRLESDDRQLRLEVPEELPPVVGDRDQILQVMHNLISNALKYGRTGTPILVRAAVEPQHRGDDMVRVQVVDEGEGIAPEHLPRLTERFYRVDTGRSRSMGGTGLGLAIVKHIVERHRGRLEIASRQGEGSAVSFLLPVLTAGSRPYAVEDGGDAGDDERHKSVTSV
jgi:two-component system phosphate regulon sensor histidine kinase PhoR